MTQRWPSRSAVRREDQFTAAPDFIDPHDSRHLPMGSRIGAVWHGLSGPRRLMVVASFVALSTAGGAGLAFTLDDFGREVGTHPHASGPAAAHQDDALLADLPVTQAPPTLNGTAASPPIPFPEGLEGP